MPTVTASGPLSTPLAGVRTMVAASSNFQALVHVASAAEALSSVHIVAFDPDTQDLPFAHVFYAEDFSFTAIAGGASHVFEPNHAVIVAFEAEVPQEYRDDPDDAMLAFLNTIGAILDDMMTLAGQGGYPAVRNIAQSEPPWCTAIEDQVTEGHRQGVAFRLEWGL